MGERRARWGYGFQDKVATARTLDILRTEIRGGLSSFEAIRLADLEAWRVDDFVLVWSSKVEGNSIKWSGDRTSLNWADLVGAEGLLKEMAEGYRRLVQKWVRRSVTVRLQSNRPASTERHHAQLITSHSVADFLKHHWLQGPTEQMGHEVSAVWDKIRKHVGFEENEFAQFVAACVIDLDFPEPPNAPVSVSLDARHYFEQFQSLHKEISTWLTDHPENDEILREYLFAAIGFRQSRSDLVQQFPPPSIPYGQNSAASQRLKDLIASTSGGYLAVTGPAGVGKSTLVQNVLQDYSLFVPYYAYLPSGQGNPRDRGQSLVFFQDVVLRLDSIFRQRSSIGISDIAEGREALRQIMKKAGELYVTTGQKTILLIDGLDHVVREVDLDRPIHRELLPPDEIPNGFLIILSSQPQALLPDILQRHVSVAIESRTGRRIEVEGLNPAEVHSIVGSARAQTSGIERDALFESCKGNPLILTYLLNLLNRTPALTVEQAIAAAGDYLGDISLYYQSCLAVPLRDQSVRDVLALLSRAVPTLPLAWSLGWPERLQVEELYATILAPFIQIEDGNVNFIHNSLVAFLREETRPKISGADPELWERNYHSILAERCGEVSCLDPLGRAKVFHLLRSGKNKELLDLLSSKWLRLAIDGFLPYSEVRTLLLYGMRSAWQLSDFSNVLRLILLDFELQQRTSRMSAGQLSLRLLELDRTDIATSQVRSFGRILVQDEDALPFARRLRAYAKAAKRHDLDLIAKEIYGQVKPVRLFYQAEPMDIDVRSGPLDLLRSWTETAPLFEDVDAILEQFGRVRFAESRPGGKSVAAEKAELLDSILRSALGVGWPIESVVRILDAIAELGQSAALFASLIAVYEMYPSEQLLGRIEELYPSTKLHPDVHLLFAKLLFNLECFEDSASIVSQLKHIRHDDFNNQHGSEISAISYTVQLSRLQVLLGLEEGPLPTILNGREEAFGRIEVAARQIGKLEAGVLKEDSIADLRGILRSLLLFHNRQQVFAEFDRRENYVLNKVKPEIYTQVIRLATQVGRVGLETLRDALLELIAGPAQVQFPPPFRRQFALAFFETGVLDRKSAYDLGISSTTDAEDDDPTQRFEACFDIAEFLHKTKNDDKIDEWLGRAAKVTAGAGSHKDYHMAQLADWLVKSLGTTLEESSLPVVNKFLMALEVAGGAGGSSAATELLQNMLAIHGQRAISLAIELIDREIINVSDALEAVVIGGANAGAHSTLLSAIYTEMLSLLHPGHTSEAAVATLRSSLKAERTATARELIASIRTNSLPSHRTIVARALQDALRTDGVGDIHLSERLGPGEGDSSRNSSLYKSPSGELLTVGQMAALLSEPKREDQWNPNPSENGGYDWWRALKTVQVRDIIHLNSLVSTLAIPDYKTVDLLAWKSHWYLKLGNREAARLAAEQAVDKAQNSSWFESWDGAQLRNLYAVLAELDNGASIDKARTRFCEDLSSGKLHNMYLMNEIVQLFAFFKIGWPRDAIQVIDDYLNVVLGANRTAPEFSSFTKDSSPETIDHAICRFVLRFLAFPVVDVGVAARRALAKYALADGSGLVDLISGKPAWDGVQFEHLLAVVHIGLHGASSTALKTLQKRIVGLNRHDSVAVRAIARRMCVEQGWQWQEVRDIPTPVCVLLPSKISSDFDFEEGRALVGADPQTVLKLHRGLIEALEAQGNDAQELRSDFRRIYDDVSSDYLWIDDEYLARWRQLLLARFWLNQRASIGRESVLRLFGKRALCGHAPRWAELHYDLLYPIYDPALELFDPVERPSELKAMEWEWQNKESERWLLGENASEWSSYPTSMGPFHIIGERTLFIRPDWEWPREERYRGVLDNSVTVEPDRENLASSHDLTYDAYLEGAGQSVDQLVIWNSERQLVGPAYRWIALNSGLAKSLGWVPSPSRQFEWLDESGSVMVKSIFWRDGWTGIEPPRFESLGEGWLVLATDLGLARIRAARPNAQYHLWVERHSHGKKPYAGHWHLSSPLSSQTM
jgi:hypothetical protein